MTAEKIQRLADMVLDQTNERMTKLYGPEINQVIVNVKPRKLYTLVDVGPAHNMSGKFMVEHSTGIIYGIKGYGQVHKGHAYGTVDTIEDWYWGNYRPVRVL